MKKPITILSCLVAFGLNLAAATDTRPRVIVLTDIENEPDDAMSMVRFLSYSNHFDIEGVDLRGHVVTL